MHTRNLALLVSFFITANALAAPPGLRYRITELRPADYAARQLRMETVDLNNKGDVLLQGFVPGLQQAWLWSAGQLVDISSKIDPSSLAINPMGLNDRTEIVGLNSGVGFRFFRNQTFPIEVNLPLKPDAFVLPYDINNRGQMFASSDFVGRPFGDSFLLDNKRVTFLVQPGEAFAPTPLAMNEKGVIAGQSQKGAAIWEGGLEMVLSMPPNAVTPAPQDINDRNEVVGIVGIRDASANVTERTFWWSEGETRLLPPATGFVHDAANSINNHGDIAGWSASTFNSLAEFATLWVDGVPYDLHSLVDDKDPLKPFVHLSTSMRINNARQILAYGIDSRQIVSQSPFYELVPYLLTPERPQIKASSGISPDPLEQSPTPGTLKSLLFGEQVAHHNNTALVSEPGFPDITERVGRVAVFTRNGQGKWVRSASIDAPNGNVGFGAQLAIFNDFALIESSEHAFLYHRVQGQWKLIQQLTPQSGYTFGEATIWNNWAFISASSATAGAVHVYQFTPAGTLRGVQTLRSFSGDPADHFGQHVSVSNARVLVSADGDGNGRGAAYVFELSGSLFVKRQKLLAIDAAQGDRFGSALGISADWLAIGAPNVDGLHDIDCIGNRTTGAIYVFRRIGGTWLQQDALLSADVRDSAFSCVSQFGSHLMISGTWLVSTITLANEAGDTIVPVIFKRDTTNFIPRADAGEVFGDLDLYLSNGTLIVGVPFEQGCRLEVCVGSAAVYDLDKAGL